uniref:Synaptogyrin 2 n=1 Tax=Monodelphis domestica TaxID=13616 RepID=F6SNJ6_MONDO
MELPVSPSVPGASSLRSTGGGEGDDVNVKMDSGAYGAAKAGGSFDLERFLKQPQVIVRAVCMLFAVIVFSCIIGEGYVNRPESTELHCIFNGNEDACRYGTAIGVLAFLASVFFFVVDVYFPQISNATDRKYLVIADMVFSAFWTFLWFVGFCFLTNQWAATSPKAVLVGADSARAAISFSFFSIFSWDLEKQYSPSRWSHRLNAEEVIKAHVQVGTEGNIDLMLSQVRKSILFIQKQYTFNRGIYLCGHSAGAHLASMVLLTDWVEHEVIPNIKGSFLVSGIYDLEPIVYTYINDILQMTMEDAQRNSPMFCQKEVQSQMTSTCELIIAVGQHDSPEFLQQSLDYFQALRLHGWRVSFLEISNVDHFDIIEKMIQNEYILTQVILKTILQ